MKREKNPVIEVQIAVQWGDMDALGHVNNLAYFGYMQEARVQWLQQLDFDWNGKTSPVVVNAHCDYLKEIVYPAELLIEVSIGEIGEKGFDTLYTIRNLSRAGEVSATGSSKIVWIDKTLRKAVPLAEDILRQLRPDDRS